VTKGHLWVVTVTTVPQTDITHSLELVFDVCPSYFPIYMSLLNKFQEGARKAAIQATAFAKDSGSKLSNETRTFAQGFSLPGEAEKSAKILESFLGGYIAHLII